MILKKLISWGKEGETLGLNKISYKEMNKEGEGKD